MASGRKISQLVFPRVVALITTCNRDGKPNVAAFSFLMPLSFNPKYVAFSIDPSRHSYLNLQETGEFVVNIPTEAMLKEIWVCGSRSGREADKFRLAGLTRLESVKVRPPRIGGCPVQLECSVEFNRKFGDHHLIVGRVLEEHVETLDFKPVTHYSGRVFLRVGEAVEA
ncbi:MAG: flavin reductase family protein [Candidatus Hecatellaceae archaeon]